MKKKDVDTNLKEMLIGDTYKVLHGISVRGERHKKDDTYNQDFYACEIYPEFTFLAMADGLGSAPYSHLGAENAVLLFKSTVVDTIEREKTFDQIEISFMLYQFHEAWLMSYGEDVKQFDTTFQYIIVYEEKVLFGGIGDGLLMIANKEKILYEKQNDSLFSNQTKSLASEDCLGALEPNMISLDGDCSSSRIFILSTDGIADDLEPASIAELPNYLLNQNQLQSAAAMQNEIKQWVINWQTPNHTDDRTLCFYLTEKTGEMKWI